MKIDRIKRVSTLGILMILVALLAVPLALQARKARRGAVKAQLENKLNESLDKRLTALIGPRGPLKFGSSASEAVEPEASK